MVTATGVGGNRQVVGLVGSGVLLEGVCRALDDTPCSVMSTLEDLDQQVDHCALIVYCADLWQPAFQKAVNTRVIAAGIPLLRAYVDFGTGIVGPCVLPGTPGCVQCAETRRAALAANADDIARLGAQLDAIETPAAHPWLIAPTVDALSRVVTSEIARCLRSGDEVASHNTLIHLDLATWQLTRHRFLPEPECPDCGYLIPDTAQAATVNLQSRPKVAPETYRIRDLKLFDRELYDLYVDQSVGLIATLTQHPSMPWTTVMALMTFTQEGMWHQLAGVGRTLTYQKSRVAAIAEALERYGGQRPKRKRTTVRASFHQLGDQALDPTTLGLHTPEHYARPENGLVPYHHDLVFNWVWGYSFQRQRPILVPERIAYYGLSVQGNTDDNPPFVYENSNGCALGSCMEEAILYGILELVERDAFLMTWYARLAIPRIDLTTAPDPTVRLLMEHIEYTTGYVVHAYDATLDHAVPCVWVMAIDEQERENTPKVLCSASAHPRARQALAGALFELGTGLDMSRRHYEQGRLRDRAKALLADPFAVREMEDHALLYSSTEAFDRLSFLYRTPKQLTFQEAFGGNDREPVDNDLRDDLDTLILYYLRQGIDIVVVDQTTPEHIAGGFTCVKIVMPGMLPMTFGEQYRRCTGFRRLHEVPRALGYRDCPLDNDDINPYPHPFP